MKVPIIFSAIVIISILFFNYTGMFHRIKLAKETTPNYTMIYKKAKGSYQKKVNAHNALCSNIKKKYILQNIHNFGVYYDDPAKTETHKLESINGCISISALPENFTPPPNYKVKSLSQITGVSFKYPLKNAVSTFFGTLKLKSALNLLSTHFSLNRKTVLEIYNHEEKTISYYISILNNNPVQ